MKKVIITMEELLYVVEHRKYVQKSFVIYLSLPPYVDIQDKHLDNLPKYLKGFSRTGKPMTIELPEYGIQKVLLPF